MIIPCTIDAEVRQASPGVNLATSPSVRVNGGGSTDAREIYIYAGKVPFPPGAVVLSAVLHMYTRGSWASGNTVTAKRITQKWAESNIKWNNKPNVSATHSAAATTTAPVDGTMLTWDITNLMKDVATGSPYFGLQLTLGTHVTRAFYSTEAGNAALRPWMEITWSEAPEPPDQLSPDGSQQVATNKPILQWQFNDKAGDTTQTSIQIQVSTTGDFTTPAFDTGKIAYDGTANGSSYDLSLNGSWTGSLLTNHATLYWRIMVWDGTDLASDWSDVATFGRTDLGGLSIDSPVTTTNDTTPPINWTLTGATQERYRVNLYSLDAQGQRYEGLWEEKGTDSTTRSVTPDEGNIHTGFSYEVSVEVWDNVDRVGNDHLTQSVFFTYARDGTPTAITSLAVSGYVDPDTSATTAAVQVDFSRASAPDYFVLVVDGVEGDRIDSADCFISGTNYRMIYWKASPRQNHVYTVEAVVISSGVNKHSNNGGRSVTYATKPIGIWLNDDSAAGVNPGNYVGIFGKDSADLAIGESGTTYDLVNSRSPVRIIDVIRGYEGGINGSIIGQVHRSKFLYLKGLDSDLRLVVGDLNFPIRMEDAHLQPTPDPGDTEFLVGFTCFQVGSPWPVHQP